MRWRVTFRGKDGQQTDDVFEAASRTELFKVLSAKGINAVRIEEDDGKKRSAHRQQVGKGAQSQACTVALAGVAIIVGGVLWFVGGGNNGKPIKNDTPERPKKASTIAQPPARPDTPSTETPQQEKPEKPEPPPYVKRPGQMQLPNGKILTFPPPKEGEIRKVYANGRMYECDHLGNFKDATKRKLFETAFEFNLLAFAG